MNLRGSHRRNIGIFQGDARPKTSKIYAERLWGSITFGYPKRAFSAELLSYARLESMPLPESETYGVKQDAENKREVYAFACTQEEFEDYVRALVGYFSAREDIYYFGEAQSEPSMFIFLPQYKLCPVGEDFDYSCDSFIFHYSLSGNLGEHSTGNIGCESEDVIEISLSYGGFSSFSAFDASLTISQNPTSAYLSDEFLPDEDGGTDGALS